METTLKIFETFGFPVAMVIVLIYAIYFIIKRELKQNDDAARLISEANEKHAKYLQEQNKELTAIIADNTKAFNALIDVLNELKTMLK